MEEARSTGLGTADRRRRWPARGDGGFSTIELMVALMIVGIVLAIAVPTYLGGRAGSRNRAAQSDLRTALSSVETYRAEHGAYSADLGSLAGHDPSLPWTSGEPATGISVSLPLDADGRAVCLSRTGSAGVFVITRVASGDGSGTYFGRGSCPDDVGDLASWSTSGWSS